MNVLQAQPDLNASAMTGGLGAFGVGQPSVTLTIRLIMQGKEVGSIIGKKGDNIKRFREESGAKITISDGSCPERIVTVTGSTDSILKAFALISRKFEEVSNYLDFQDPSNLNNLNPLVSAHSQLSLSSVGTGNGQNGKSNCSLGSAGSLIGQAPVTLKLIVPASQCGSLIGKGGSKIKEIRETTGASIQVASEMLPNSTERAVTLSGSADSITKSIYQICCVMLESPPKGPTIPYRPKPAMPPVFFAGGQAYTIQGQFAIPHPDAFGASLPTPTPYFETAQSCALQHQAAAAFLSQHFSQLSQQQQITSQLQQQVQQSVGGGGHSHHSHHSSLSSGSGQSTQSPPNISSLNHHHLSSSHSSPTSGSTGLQSEVVSAQGSPPQPANGLSPASGFLDLSPAAAAAAAQFATNSGFLTKLHRLALQHAPLLPPGHAGVGSLSPQATLATLANSAASLGHHSAAATNAGVVPSLTTEMTIPNDIIGSVIGKGGAKINEIRQLSGANIKINNSEEGTKDRTVIISGTAEAINLAQYLIATSSNGLLNHHINSLHSSSGSLAGAGGGSPGNGTTSAALALAAAAAAAVNSGGSSNGSSSASTNSLNSLSAMAAVAAAVSNSGSVSSSGAGSKYSGSAGSAHAAKHALASLNSLATNGSSTKPNKNDRKMLHSNQMSSYSQQQQQQQVPTTSNTTSSSPSSSGTSSNGGSYQQLTNQQLQYALLYKNYVQPFVSQYFPPTTAQYGSSTSGTGTAQYYSSSSAQSAGSYMNGGSGMASGTTVVNNNLNTATGASSRSDSSDSSSSNDGGGVSSGQQHHNHGIYKSDSSHSNGSSALISEVSHHHSSSGHHHGGHHHHHHHHLSHQYSEYELSSNGYHHPHHHHQLMMNSATPSSATNAYAASLASMARF